MVLFITTEGSRGEVQEFVKQNKFSEAVIQDPNLDISKRLGVNSVPIQVLVDRQGIVRYVHASGKGDNLDAFERQIKALLNKTGSK